MSPENKLAVKGIFFLVLVTFSGLAHGWTDQVARAEYEMRLQLAGTACTLATKYGYRIPHGKTGNKTRGVVFFQHGLTDSSAGACLNEPGNGLIWYLADMGYDVWLGNNRGNGISMTNYKYGQNTDQFWDFEWADFAKYDLPAHIKYVKSATKASKVAYVGHSQGTIQAFSGFVIDPTLANDVSVFIALAPIAYVKHVDVLILQLMANLNVDALFRLLGIREFWLPSVIHKILPGVCNILPFVCNFVLQALSGDFPGIENGKISFWLGYEPNPTSVKNIAHWSQSVREGTFGYYNYGATENLKRYGQKTAPQFDLTKFPAHLPTALFAGSRDALGDTKDVQTLIQLLPNPFVHYETNFGHLDFILGKNTKNTFGKLLHYIQAYNVPISE